MKENIQQLVRIVNADINGEKKVYSALRSIKGLGYSFANAVCLVLNFDPNIKIGSLSEDEIKKIEDVVRHPDKYKIPTWLFNRRKDYETGEDKHLIATDIKFQKELDIKRLQTIKSYRGIRHASGLPVRGQRTRSHFRKGATIGVSKKKIIASKAKESKSKEKVK